MSDSYLNEMPYRQSSSSNPDTTPSNKLSDYAIPRLETNIHTVQSEEVRNVSRLKRVGNGGAETQFAEWTRLAIDNGAYEVKLGWPSREVTRPLTHPSRIIPNAIAKIKIGMNRRLVGEEIDTYSASLSGAIFRRPFDRVSSSQPLPTHT